MMVCRRKLIIREEKPAPVPFLSPRISYEDIRELNQRLHGGKLAPDRLTVALSIVFFGVVF
jgi:hypothetical protein